jgi:hypothetical protein
LAWIAKDIDSTNKHIGSTIKYVGPTIADRGSTIKYIGSTIVDGGSTIKHIGPTIVYRGSTIKYIGSTIVDILSPKNCIIEKRIIFKIKISSALLAKGDLFFLKSEALYF